MVANEHAFMTCTEVAEFLRVTPWSIREMARSGRIPHRKFGRRLLFEEGELRAWMDGATLETTSLPAGGRRVRTVS